MKKTFPLKAEGKNADRLLEATKHEIRKYIKREQNKFMAPYHMYQKRFKEDPKLSDVLEDNFNRLVVFCGLERLLTLR